MKTNLLDIGLVFDNEYLDKYCNLIEENKNSIIEYGQNHHIIPRYYYKHNSMKINNDDSNFVRLSYQDHILAHYYLFNCSDNVLYRRCNAYAIFMMLKKLTVDKFELTDSIYEIINNLDIIDMAYEHLKNRVHKPLTQEQQELIYNYIEKQKVI